MSAVPVSAAPTVQPDEASASNPPALWSAISTISCSPVSNRFVIGAPDSFVDIRNMTGRELQICIRMLPEK